jgi:hypothetical protein
MAIAIAAMGLALLLLVGVIVGIVLVMVIIDSHRGDPFGKLTERPPTRAQATTRRILGVGTRDQREEK